MIVISGNRMDLINQLITEVKHSSGISLKAARNRILFQFLQQDPDRCRLNRILIDNSTVSRIAILPVQGYITVKREILQDKQSVRSPAGGNYQLYTGLLQPIQRIKDCVWNLMGRTIGECTVNIEKYRLDQRSASSINRTSTVLSSSNPCALQKSRSSVSMSILSLQRDAIVSG